LAGTGDFLAESTPNRLRISGPALDTHPPRTTESGAGPHLVHPGVCPRVISLGVDHSAQPQACRDHQGRTQPRDPTTTFDPDFVRWDVLQIQVSSSHPASCTAWHGWPARSRQSAIVRSSKPYALTIAWIGHPYASNVTTITTRVGSIRKPANIVPVRSLKVFPQHGHWSRRRF
jgi:hypothetical protein